MLLLAIIISALREWYRPLLLLRTCIALPRVLWLVVTRNEPIIYWLSRILGDAPPLPTRFLRVAWVRDPQGWNYAFPDDERDNS